MRLGVQFSFFMGLKTRIQQQQKSIGGHMSVNKVIIVGNLGQDPESRTTPNGTVITRLSVATNEKWKDNNGNLQERVEWHRVVTFGKTAEAAAKYLEKGRQVYLEGKLRTNKWQDKDGVDRWTTEIIADEVKFLGSGKRDDKEDRGSRNTGRQDSHGFEGDDDIPF